MERNQLNEWLIAHQDFFEKILRRAGISANQSDFDDYLQEVRIACCGISDKFDTKELFEKTWPKGLLFQKLVWQATDIRRKQRKQTEREKLGDTVIAYLPETFSRIDARTLAIDFWQALDSREQKLVARLLEDETMTRQMRYHCRRKLRASQRRLLNQDFFRN